METRRSPLGWSLSLLLGSALGALLSYASMRILSPTAFLVNEVSCPSLGSTSSERPALDDKQVLSAAASSNVSSSASPPGGKFSPGENGNWSSIDALLRRGGELQKQLAVSRRTFLWQSKMKMSKLKGILKQVKAVQDRQALTFFVDDRGVTSPPEGLRDLRSMERKEVLSTWQEVDQDTRAEPQPIMVQSLQGAIERAQRSSVWGSVQNCTAGLRQIEVLSGRVRRIALAEEEAEAEASLAAIGKSRIEELWTDPGVWVEAFRGEGPNLIQKYLEDKGQRKQRSELAFWAFRFHLVWPMEGPKWYTNRGSNEPETRALSREALAERLSSREAEWSKRREEVGKAKGRVEKQLEETITSTRATCGVSEETMESLLLSVGGPSGLGICDNSALSAADQAPSKVQPRAPSLYWKKDWLPDSQATLEDREEGLSFPPSDLRPPINVSVLLLVHWNVNLGDSLKKLQECSEGLRGEREVGAGGNVSMEVLVAVDSNLASSFRETVKTELEDRSKPWFLTRVVAVSNGGGGLSAARAYNILASLARGEVLLLFDPSAAWSWSNSCNFIPRILEPFKTWPRMAAVGEQLGHMSLYNTPGADYLSIERNAAEPTHSRLKDPLLKDRMQFLLGTANQPLAFRRSIFLSFGGFDEQGNSNLLREYDLCRRLWLAGYQVSMVMNPSRDYIGMSQRSRMEREFWKPSDFGALEDHTFGSEIEGRIVAEVKRMNRFLKPLPIWE